jgi:hypothetical protein
MKNILIKVTADETPYQKYVEEQGQGQEQEEQEEEEQQQQQQNLLPHQNES